MLHPVIVQTHDLDYIARFTLRRQWPELSAAEQVQFQTAFQTLAVSNYVSRFRDLQGAAFEIVADDPLPRGRRQVLTVLKPVAGEAVTLNYVLHERDGWRIINVIADDVSDLALKRAEYQRLFGIGGLGGLLKALDEQIERLRN